MEANKLKILLASNLFKLSNFHCKINGEEIKKENSFLAFDLAVLKKIYSSYMRILPDMFQVPIGEKYLVDDPECPTDIKLLINHIARQRNEKLLRTNVSDNFRYNHQDDSENVTEHNHSEAMYFDAMTDGQLGDYDDFKEQGGSIDDIDTWARG